MIGAVGPLDFLVFQTKTILFLCLLLKIWVQCPPPTAHVEELGPFETCWGLRLLIGVDGLIV